MAPLKGAPGADGVGGRAQVHHKTEPAHSASEHVDVQAAQRKRFESLRASLAMRGHAVYQLQCGAFLIVWRGLTREVRTVDELEAHARRIGAPL